MSTIRRSARVAAQAGSTKIESLPTAKVTKPKKSTKKVEEPKKEEPKIEEPKKEEVKEEEPKIEEAATDSKELEVGDEIPDLSLLNQDDKFLSLKDLASKHDLIIIFAYPKASTPGCTRQACGFRNNFNDIKDKALVLGLSADSPKAQLAFKTKQNLQYDLLSDPKKELIGLLGAKKSPSGIKRSHWIFQNGKLVVKRVQISPEASISEGKEQILQLSK